MRLHFFQEQQENVNQIESNVEVAHVEVEKGVNFLEKAARYKVSTYPLAGAFIGSCIGGPVGFVAGLKLGSLTAIGCGLLGKSLFQAIIYFAWRIKTEIKKVNYHRVPSKKERHFFSPQAIQVEI